MPTHATEEQVHEQPRPRELVRYAAFAESPGGGNPAAVVLDAHGMSDDEMLALAAQVDYSETSFLFRPANAGRREYGVRYFSPLDEVPFCGHATIATAIALAERDGVGDLVLHTRSGRVPVTTSRDRDQHVTATLESVSPRLDDLRPGELDTALSALRWSADELDPLLPPRFAYAGARHLVLAARSRGRLAALDYDFGALKAFMLEHELSTVHLVWRETESLYHVRAPFAVGGIVEDPATGAAAAAFGAYLRELGLLSPPAVFSIHQGDDMGRPSRLTVEIVQGRPEIRVAGRAVRIDAAA